MLFSEYFKVDIKVIENYGAINLNLNSDRQLFIDPLLIFHDKKYINVYKKITDYLSFILTASQNIKSNSEKTSFIKTYLMFPEVKENWLGFSKSGNRGTGLSYEFGEYLFDNIQRVFENIDYLETVHLEKIALLNDRIGKDRISDFVTNIIKSFLCDFTEIFTLEHLNEDQYENVFVDRAIFDYESGTFIAKKYKLPIIRIDEKREYVLLTPSDIVRTGEQSINKIDMYKTGLILLEQIPNSSLRDQVNSLLDKWVQDFRSEFKKKHVKEEPSEASIEKYKVNKMPILFNDYPELLDAYIRYKEINSKVETDISRSEVEGEKMIIEVNGKELKSILESISTRTFDNDIKVFMKEFKFHLENKGSNMLFYNGNTRIVTTESQLQALFSLANIGFKYNIDKEINNGRGPVDFRYKSLFNSKLVEFKLASNSHLKHVFQQIKVYEDVERPNTESLIVIFYFNDEEKEKVDSLIELYDLVDKMDDTIFIIDCKLKQSASKVR